MKAFSRHAVVGRTRLGPPNRTRTDNTTQSYPSDLCNNKQDGCPTIRPTIKVFRRLPHVRIPTNSTALFRFAYARVRLHHSTKVSCFKSIGQATYYYNALVRLQPLPFYKSRSAVGTYLLGITNGYSKSVRVCVGLIKPCSLPTLKPLSKSRYGKISMALRWVSLSAYSTSITSVLAFSFGFRVFGAKSLALFSLTLTSNLM